MFSNDLFLDVFVALFALLNPLFAIPVFLGLTGGYDARARQRTAAIAALTTFIALIVAALIGDHILLLIGVHVPSFQIAGGLIVLTIALGMLKGEGEEDADAKEAAKEKEATPGKSIAVYPLAIPLLAGPGVFVTTIVFSSRAESVADFVTLTITIAAIVAILWLSMAFAGTAARFLNKTAINIGTKVLGILLAAVSVEMIIAGIDAHFLPLFAAG
ncbi:MAG: NAAT family transporter [Alphaproteobacteria bacterium]|nr:NAAT family transporter [Alphaproteobacteria bacterium]